MLKVLVFISAKTKVKKSLGKHVDRLVMSRFRGIAIWHLTSAVDVFVLAVNAS